MFSSSTTDVSQANHPIVLIAKAINAAMKQIPANANTTTMPYVGLPGPGGGTWGSATNIYDVSNYYSFQVYIYSNNTIATNYCYLVGASGNQNIACVFGPS